MSDSKKGAQVRALLDTADSYRAEGNDQAAAAYEAKAAELMVKYRVELEETLAHDEAAEKPVQRDFDLVGMGSKYRSQYAAMWYWIAKHCEVETWQEYRYSEEGYKLVAHAVGYAGDLDYAEMLFTAARLVFTEKLEPKVDPNLTDQVNVYRLRSAGIERIRISETMWGNTDKVFLGRVGRLYKAECEARGEQAMLSGRGVTGKAYRDQYAEQFVSTLSGRLWSARQAASASGGGLVLHGRKERIREAFYAFYPDQRPKPELEYVDPRKDCSKCKAAKSGECREHHVPMGRMSSGPDYNSVAAERGRMAGRAAARDVGINRSGGTKELS
jgi:hypothetical protein